MTGFKTEGIILKRRNFSEADRILTVFTLHKGKVSIIAKGVRRITSRRAGNVELLNRVTMYLHQGKNFLILTEATANETYSKLKESLALSTHAYHIIELIDKLTAEEQENRKLYFDLTEVLKRLANNPRQIWIRAFEVKLLVNLGFWSVENLPNLNMQTKQILSFLEQATWDEIEHEGLKMVDENLALELEQALRYQIETIIEGQLKSRKFLSKI